MRASASWGWAAEGGGLAGEAVPVEQVEGRVTKRGQVQRGRAGMDAAGVFALGLVADVEDAVFDAPMLAVQTQQRRRVGFFARQGGDAVGDLRRGSAVKRALSDERERLGRGRPGDATGRRVRADERSRLDSATCRAELAATLSADPADEPIRARPPSRDFGLGRTFGMISAAKKWGFGATRRTGSGPRRQKKQNVPNGIGKQLPSGRIGGTPPARTPTACHAPAGCGAWAPSIRWWSGSSPTSGPTG
jgi:hypothetical protein